MATPKPRGYQSVYVVYLRDPQGDGKAGYYVGMTGLRPEARFVNHKAGKKAASVVWRFGERLVPKLYAHLNPMPYEKAVRMEVALAEGRWSLRTGPRGNGPGAIGPGRPGRRRFARHSLSLRRDALILTPANGPGGSGRW